MTPQRGDFVEVRWVDTSEDPVGDPNKATLSHRVSYGIYWDQRTEGDLPVLVTTTTIDKDGPDQQGYCIYPMSNVTSLLVIKRKRRRKGDKKCDTTSTTS